MSTRDKKNRKLDRWKFGEMGGMIAVVGLCFVLFVWLHGKEEKPLSSKSEVCLRIDPDEFEKALCDSCDFSGTKLACSPMIKERITNGLDSVSLSKIEITDRHIKFSKKNGYIEVPASVIAKMIDENLFTIDTVGQ